MRDYAHPLRPAERLGDVERLEAVDALARARDEGRLTPAEFDERAAAARAAVTWGDLVPQFADLPQSTGPESSVRDGAYGDGAYGYGAQGGYGGPRGHGPRDGDPWGTRHALGGPWGATIMAFVPFVALGLFFVCGFALDGWAWSWLWFLLIPIAGVVIYGPASQQRGRS